MKQMIFASAALALLAGCGGNAPDTPATTPTAGGAKAGCATRAYAEIGGPISLIDQTGTPRTEEDFKGKHSLVFFGFTYCPDVCPMTLVKIDRALARLPDGFEAPQVLLITVDPERDTPEELANYLQTEAYPEGTFGLTGSPEQIKQAADNFIASYARIEQPDSTAGYTMDHTALIYLMDPDWKLKTFFDGEATDEKMATCLQELM